MIKSFYIHKLYNEKNIKINFEEPYKILVSENGSGKTTVLNSFYALLSGDISKLKKIFFEKIGIHFTDDEKIEFFKSEFDSEILTSHCTFINDVENRLGKKVVLDLLSEINSHGIDRVDMTPVFRHICMKMDIPRRILREQLEEFVVNEISDDTKDKLKEVAQKLNLATLYLPTYRRVEEDIRILGRSERWLTRDIMNINFGMSDVKESIDVITSEIRSSSVEWFAKINGQMLSQLVNGFSVSDEMKHSISDPKAVEIVLERIGKNITEAHKQQILDLVISGDIQEGHEPLIYFVSNLLKVYEQQQENDQAIQKFTTVANKYLVDKEIVYNESNVTVEVIRKKNKRSVSLDSLSSGEKQIISLFAILYLQKKENLAIFFDEPELSLSMEWQKTLLPDIIDSGKCKFLFSTTHSPFIFDNELRKYTVDLAEYVEEILCQE